MSNLIPEKIVIIDGIIQQNNGKKYKVNDAVQPEAISGALSCSAYSQVAIEALMLPPDVSEINGSGTPLVSFNNVTIDGIEYKKFKFSNLKGESGASTWAQITGKPVFGTASTKDTGTTSGTIPVLDSNGKLATSIVPDVAVDVIRYNTTQNLSSTEKAKARSNMGAGTSNFSGSYTDLTSKPTLGTVASKNTGTTSGDIPIINTNGKINRGILPNADDAGNLGAVAGQSFANRNKVGATYIEVLIDSAGMAYAFYPNIDTAMSDSSINLVQNKIVKAYVDNMVGDIETLLAGV